MTSKEFVIWLRGFVAASHNYNITPKQWDELKDTLKTVEDTVLILKEENIVKDEN